MQQYQELKGFKQVLFTIGHIGPGMLNQFITTWLLVFLVPSEGSIVMKASLVGIALMIGRLIDAIADPYVANLSDQLRNKKRGRRIPFIVLGSIPMIVSFNLLWFTPSLPELEILRFIWILIHVNVFYFSYTVVVNPYFALLPEITKSHNQRMYIQSFVAFFGILGMGIAMGASGFLIDAFGFQLAGLFLSMICLITLIGPILAVRVNIDYKEEVKIEKRTSLVENVRSALANKTFRTYMIGFSIFFLGFQLIQYNMVFITTILLQLERSMSSILFISSVVSAVAFIPIYNIIVKKVGAITALKIAILSYVVIAFMLAFIPIILQTGISSMTLGFIFMILVGFPYSGLMVIPNVLVSSIIDEDVKTSGKRREALFFGVQGLINKFMVSISALVVGLLLDLFGNSIAHPLGVILVAPLASIAAVVGFIFINKLNAKALERVQNDVVLD